MPKKSTKHIPKKRDPIGWVKNGRIKTVDGDTGKVVWRGVRRGMAHDIDGDVTSAVRNRDQFKENKTHSPRSGRPRKRTPETRG